MRFKLFRSNKDRQDKVWDRWYAWRPVFAESAEDGSGVVFVWLEYVERKEYLGYCGWTWPHRKTGENEMKFRRKPVARDIVDALKSDDHYVVQASDGKITEVPTEEFERDYEPVRRERRARKAKKKDAQT